jgi:hypothetical protein
MPIGVGEDAPFRGFECCDSEGVLRSNVDEMRQEEAQTLTFEVCATRPPL